MGIKCWIKYCCREVIGKIFFVLPLNRAEVFRRWYILLGVLDIRNPQGVHYGVADWVVHPFYHLRHTASINDIAIVKVDHRIIYTPSIQPVCLISTNRCM